MNRIRIDQIVIDSGISLDRFRFRLRLREALTAAFEERPERPASDQESLIASAIARKVKEASRG